MTLISYLRIPPYSLYVHALFYRYVTPLAMKGGHQKIMMSLLSTLQHIHKNL